VRRWGYRKKGCQGGQLFIVRWSGVQASREHISLQTGPPCLVIVLLVLSLSRPLSSPRAALRDLVTGCAPPIVIQLVGSTSPGERVSDRGPRFSPRWQHALEQEGCRINCGDVCKSLSAVADRSGPGGSREVVGSRWDIPASLPLARVRVLRSSTSNQSAVDPQSIAKPP
jgi:hypothetical protein